MTAISDTAAWLGVGRLEAAILWERYDAPLSGMLHEFLSELEQDILKLEPVGASLTRADEIRMARNCVVLAYFEQFYRSSFSAIFDGARDGTLRSGADILLLPRADVVEDVAAMSSAFFHSQFPLLAGRAFVLNPIFAGSSDVGGADADIIAGDSLIDFKSTGKPLASNHLYQLLSYPCLDYSDQYQIRRVGFSVLRRNVLREWDIEALVETLSSGRTKYGVLRERIHALAVNLRTAPPTA